MKLTSYDYQGTVDSVQTEEKKVNLITDNSDFRVGNRERGTFGSVEEWQDVNFGERKAESRSVKPAKVGQVFPVHLSSESKAPAPWSHKFVLFFNYGQNFDNKFPQKLRKVLWTRPTQLILSLRESFLTK